MGEAYLKQTPLQNRHLILGFIHPLLLCQAKKMRSYDKLVHWARQANAKITHAYVSLEGSDHKDRLDQLCNILPERGGNIFSKSCN